VEPIYEKGVDQPSMDEARVLLVRMLTFVDLWMLSSYLSAFAYVTMYY